MGLLIMVSNEDAEPSRLNEIIWETDRVCSTDGHARFWEFVATLIPAYAKSNTEELTCRIYAVDETWSQYIMLMEVGNKEYCLDCDIFNGRVKAHPYERTWTNGKGYGEWKDSEHWSRQRGEK